MEVEAKQNGRNSLGDGDSGGKMQNDLRATDMGPGGQKQAQKKRNTIGDALKAAGLDEFAPKTGEPNTTPTSGGGSVTGPTFQGQQGKMGQSPMVGGNFYGNPTFNSMGSQYFYNYPQNYGFGNAMYQQFGQQAGASGGFGGNTAQKPQMNFPMGMMNNMLYTNPSFTSNPLYNAFNQSSYNYGGQQGGQKNVPQPAAIDSMLQNIHMPKTGGGSGSTIVRASTVPPRNEPLKSGGQQSSPANGQSGIEPHEWPPELKDYVKRTFAKCENEDEMKYMEKQLKDIINGAKQRGEIFTKNWRSFPVPMLKREMKKQMLIEAAQSVSSKKHPAPPPPPPPPQGKPSNWSNSGSGSGGKGSMGKQTGSNLQKRPLSAFDSGGLPGPTKRFQSPPSIGKEGFESMLGGASSKRLGKANSKWSSGPAKKGGFSDPTGMDPGKVSQRHTRFGNAHQGKKTGGESTGHSAKHLYNLSHFENNEDMDFDQLAIKWQVVGTSTQLERAYLRITEQPDPAMIRPEPVLKEAMKHLLKKWADGKAEYHFISDQFRSMRQDLIVQHIKNNFTVKVYENNVRISLESHDFGQFHQCLNQLYALYQQGLKGNFHEFVAYRIATHVFTNNKYQLGRQLEVLKPEDFEEEEIKFVLKLKTSMATGNYHKVFQMYKKGPRLMPFLFDMFVQKLRIWALARICKAFGNKIELTIIKDHLAFNDMQAAKDFLKETGGEIDEEGTGLLLKESAEVFGGHDNYTEFQ